MSINRVNITGNLTRDPELRATAGGTQVLSFGVAVNDRRRNAQTGEWEDYPNFVDCTMFGTRAEAVSRFLAKGNKVAIEGKLRYSSWERDGQKRSKLEVVVDEIELMSQNPNGRQAPQQYAPQGYQQQAYAPQQPAPQAYAPQPAPRQPAQQWNAQQAYQNPPAVPRRPHQAPAPTPQAYAPQQAPQPAPQQPAPAQQQLDVYDEDIPF